MSRYNSLNELGTLIQVTYTEWLSGLLFSLGDLQYSSDSLQQLEADLDFAPQRAIFEIEDWADFFAPIQLIPENLGTKAMRENPNRLSTPQLQQADRSTTFIKHSSDEGSEIPTTFGLFSGVEAITPIEPTLGKKQTMPKPGGVSNLPSDPHSFGLNTQSALKNESPSGSAQEGSNQMSSLIQTETSVLVRKWPDFDSYPGFSPSMPSFTGGHTLEDKHKNKTPMMMTFMDQNKPIENEQNIGFSKIGSLQDFSAWIKTSATINEQKEQAQNATTSENALLLDGLENTRGTSFTTSNQDPIPSSVSSNPFLEIEQGQSGDLENLLDVFSERIQQAYRRFYG